MTSAGSARRAKNCRTPSTTTWPWPEHRYPPPPRHPPPPPASSQPLTDRTAQRRPPPHGVQPRRRAAPSHPADRRRRDDQPVRRHIGACMDSDTSIARSGTARVGSTGHAPGRRGPPRLTLPDFSCRFFTASPAVAGAAGYLHGACRLAAIEWWVRPPAGASPDTAAGGRLLPHPDNPYPVSRVTPRRQREALYRVPSHNKITSHNKINTVGLKINREAAACRAAATFSATRRSSSSSSVASARSS